MNFLQFIICLICSTRAYAMKTESWFLQNYLHLLEYWKKNMQSWEVNMSEYLQGLKKL